MPDGHRLDASVRADRVGAGVAVGAIGGQIANLANLISFARLCAVPVTVWLVERGHLQAGFAMFLAAGLSDALDGWLARHLGGSRLGAVLDPLADKALLTSMYVVMAVVGLLPDWLAILVVFRDLVIVGGVMLMTVLGEPVIIRPLLVSKLNTLLQIALVACVLLLDGFGLGWAGMIHALAAAVAATTLVSGAAYVRNAITGRG